MGRLLDRIFGPARGDNYDARGQFVDADRSAGSQGKGQAGGGASAPAPNAPAGTGWGVSGWRPGGVKVAPIWDQIGVYGDAMLNQYPARWEGQQLYNGRQGNNPGWAIPGPGMIPSWQATQNIANVPGALRMAGKPSNPAGVGPIAARQMRESVVMAQIQQSGLAAMSWAQALKVWGTGS